MNDTHFTKSGSSPGASNDSFVCSGNSPTSPLVRPASSASSDALFKDFQFVEVNRPTYWCIASAEITVRERQPR
jgi:hypothetical protein